MNDDWFDLLSALLHAEARFLVVGAHALAAHGIPRGTQDLDVWIEPTPENAQRVWDALSSFGAPMESLHLSVDDLTRTDVVIQLGAPPTRIDLLTGLSGVPDFSSARVGAPLAPGTVLCRAVSRPRRADGDEAGGWQAEGSGGSSCIG